MSTERIQKILAQAGIASRRKAEELIEMGLVTVNGKVAKIGEKADLETDAIKVEGKLILRTENHVYIAFYKPRGVISMMADPEGRPTIADYLTKVKARVFPIGRLDYNSEGLLLLTNDGELVEKIQKNDEYPRVYHVKIKGHVTAEMLERLRRGGKVGTRFVKPHSVRIADELNKKTKIEIVFVNAANVDVKTYFEMKGFLIERMTRTAFGNLTLTGLVPGQYRIIPKSKLEALLEQPELGLKQLEYKNSKEDEILPKDQRMGSVDTDGKIRIKAVSTPIAPRSDSSDRPAFKKRPGFKRDTGFKEGRSSSFRSARSSDRFGGSEDRGFKSDRPRSDRGGFKPRGPRTDGGFRSERSDRFEGRSSRTGFGGGRSGPGTRGGKPGGFKKEGGFGGGRSAGPRGPRAAGGPGARSGKPASAGGKRFGGGGARRPITTVKRRAD